MSGAAQDSSIPRRSPNLGRVLPAAPVRSSEQARQLMAHLPLPEDGGRGGGGGEVQEGDAARLRTTALCLARERRRLHISLPTELHDRERSLRLLDY